MIKVFTQNIPLIMSILMNSRKYLTILILTINSTYHLINVYNKYY